MKVIEAEGQATKYVFRQSWMNDWMMCNYRAHEVSAKFPDGTPPSFQTATGTAAHAGVEADLAGADFDGVCDAISAAYSSEVAKMTVEYRRANAPEIKRGNAMATNCAQELISQVLPQLRGVDSIEKKFKLLVGREFDLTGAPIEIWISGTWDLDEGPGLPLWDWKTAGGEYQPWQVRRWYIQPTFYTLAKAILNKDITTVQQFKYGIAVKRVGKPQIQIVDCERGPTEWAWMISLMKDAVDQHTLSMAPRNDHGWHCSAKWCVVWDECKGAERQLPSVLLNQPTQKAVPNE
jgi:hypothetical protein